MHTKILPWHCKLIQLYPGNEVYNINRGIALLKMSEFEKAIQDFNSAIEKNDKVPQAYFNRANAYVNLDMPDKACKDMRSAAELGFDAAFDHIRNICQSGGERFPEN